MFRGENYVLPQDPPAVRGGGEEEECGGMAHIQVTKAEAGSLPVITSVFDINTQAFPEGRVENAAWSAHLFIHVTRLSSAT